MVRGTKSGQEAPYGLGELDLAGSSGSLELDVAAPANSQMRADDGDSARFFASLETARKDGPTEPARGASFDDDDALWADLPSLELAHDPRQVSEPPKRRSSQLPASTPPADAAGSDTPAAPAPRPTAVVKLRELGPPPSVLWKTPAYALQAALYMISVLRSERTLASERAEAEAELSRALVALGRALLEVRGAPELAQLKPKFASVDEQLAQRASVAGALREVHDSRAALDTALGVELTRLGEERAPFAARARSADEALQKAELEASRAEALAKRAEIALRAAKQAVSLPAGTRIEDLEAALGAQQAERERVAGLCAEARVEAERARGELEAKDAEERAQRARHEQRVSDVEKRGAALDKRIALITSGEEAALRALAVAARAANLAGLSRSQAEAAEKCARVLESIEGDVLRVREARGRVHQKSVIHGASIVLGVLMVLLVALR